MEKYPEAFDIIILDLTMPKMSGVETFYELRKIIPDIRILLTSGYEEQEASKIVSHESNTAFLQKPYHLETLQQALTKLLNL